MVWSEKYTMTFALFLVDAQPDTHEVDRSEIRTQILLATASSALKGRHSFTHMLTEVRPQRYRLKSIKVVSVTSNWNWGVFFLLVSKAVFPNDFQIIFKPLQVTSFIVILFDWTIFPDEVFAF